MSATTSRVDSWVAHVLQGDDGITLHDLSDAGLTRVMRQYRRGIEDGVADADQLTYYWRSARAIQLFRFRLRLRYGARHRDEGGTHSYDRWQRFDESPSYELAWLTDLNRCAQGQSHVVPLAAMPADVRAQREAVA